MAEDKILVFEDYRDDKRPILAYADLSYDSWFERIWTANQDGVLPDKAAATGSEPAFVSSGRWLWQCRACMTAYQAQQGELGICAEMCGGNWRTIVFPDNQAAIEAELLKQPGYRHISPVRHWLPHMSLSDLEYRTARAEELKAEGVDPITHLSLSTPHLFVANSTLFASQLNSNRATIQELSGRSGRVDVENAVRVKTGTSHTTQPYLHIAQDHLGLPVQGGDPSVTTDGAVTYRSDTDRMRVRSDGDFTDVAFTGDIPKVVILTQTAYDELTPKDANTVYVVSG